MFGELATAIRHFCFDRRGATSIEYAMIACFMSIAIVSAVTGMGANLKTVFYDKLLTLF